MDVRLFPDRRAFVRNHMLEVEPLNNSSFIIPLNREQVDLNTIQIQGTTGNIYLSVRSLTAVSKEDSTYVGALVDYTDGRVTLSQGANRLTIRNYDEIEEGQYIIGRSSTGITPDELILSYLTSGINGNVVHSLDIDNQQIESDLVVSNGTFNDITDAQFEVITAEQVPSYSRLYSANFASESIASPEESAAGTIYVVDGRYDVPAGFDVSIPLIRNDVDTRIIYVINAPNGQANATYTVQWIAPADLPSGSLYVYRGGELETVSSIQSTGEGQRRDIPLLVIPSVYARGTITRNGAQQSSVPVITLNGDNVPPSTERRASTTNVSLIGTVTNSLSDQITVHIRYTVGEGRVSVNDGTVAQREGVYLAFPISLGPNSIQPYDFSFDVTS